MPIALSGGGCLLSVSSRWLFLVLAAALTSAPTVEIAAPEGPGPLPSPFGLSSGGASPLAVPTLRNDRERAAWELVARYCGKYGIEEKAPFLFGVIYQESRCFPDVVSPCRRYFGMCQFTQKTFRASVGRMKRLGLLDQDATLSPMEPEHAVHVMAWMWSQGGYGHWGPAKRILRQLARTSKASYRRTYTPSS